MNVEKLEQEIREIEKSKGWEQVHLTDWPLEATTEQISHYKLAAKLALVHEEVSEAVRALRHGDRENFGEELGDIIIRVLGITGGLGIDIEHEIYNKNAYNSTRPERHGGKAF